MNWFLFFVMILIAGMAGTTPFAGWLFLTDFQPMDKQSVLVVLAVTTVLYGMAGADLVVAFRKIAIGPLRVRHEGLVASIAMVVLAVCWASIALAVPPVEQLFYWFAVIFVYLAYILFALYANDVYQAAKSTHSRLGFGTI